MPILRPKHYPAATATVTAGAIRWRYDRAELIADGVVHILGLVCGLIAATALVVLSGVFGTSSDIVAACVYATGLLAMLGLSAAYNLWPVSPSKWLLRRFDHAAIFLLIAGTYTPVVLQISESRVSISLLVGVWCISFGGMFIKLRFPGRFDRLAIVLYLALGWSGLIAYDSLVNSLPLLPLWFIAIGGALYTLGVVFHTWERLRFQNAIWHGFVLLGAACHYTAVLDLVLT